MEEGGRKVQYATGICATFTMVYQGLALGWSSPAIPKLISGEAGLTLTKAQCSWVASLVPIGAVFGSLIAQYLGEKIGRKKTILLANLPSIIGSGLTFIKIPYVLYISRTISGMGGAMAIVVVSIYLGEIADKEIRGSLGTLLTTMSNLGNLIIYASGPFVSYDTLNWICLSLAITSFFICSWIPESPYYFLKSDNIEGAQKLRMRFRSLTSVEPIKGEVMEIQKQVKYDMKRRTSVKELFTKPVYRKAVIILSGLNALQQVTGTLVIQSYLETIFIAANLNLADGVGSIIYGVVQLIAGTGATILVDKVGRKPLLLISSIGIGILLSAVGIYFYMQDALHVNKETMSALSWIPLVGIIGFNILFVVGIGNLPFVYQSELFPTNVKSVASSVFTIYGAMIAFIVTKAYQSVVDLSGVYVAFWIFAFMSFAGVFFIHFVIPETKGKTLEEIQEILNPKSTKNVKSDESSRGTDLNTTPNKDVANVTESAPIKAEKLQ